MLYAAEDENVDEICETNKKNWKVLIVDDEPEIHTITKMALRDFEFNGKGLEFISAYSGAEAKELIFKHMDTSLIFMDVVMEHEEAGLEAVKFIREEAKNDLARIILRTGQPGQAPERRVILDYDINDYKTKTELTSQKLFTSVVASLRSFQDLETINLNRQGLEDIIEASASLFELQSMEKFVHGVLTQLVSLLGLERNAFYCSSCFISGKNMKDLEVLAGTGDFENHHEKPPLETISSSIVNLLEKAAMAKKSIFEETQIVVYFDDNSCKKSMIYLETSHPVEKMDRQLLEIFCSNVAVAYGNIQLTQEMEKTQKEITNRLAAVAETRSKETGNHIRRVAGYCRLLAKLHGIDDKEADLISEAATMHDIGKVGVADNILNKPGKLTEDEFNTMKEHSKIGHEIFKNSDRPLLQSAAIIALEHHERYEGGGYPAGIKGEEIHVHSRIATMADVFDALSANRVYKDAWPDEDILNYIKEERGKHFDPNLSDLFIENFDKFTKIRTEYAD